MSSLGRSVEGDGGKGLFLRIWTTMGDRDGRVDSSKDRPLNKSEYSGQTKAGACVIAKERRWEDSDMGNIPFQIVCIVKSLELLFVVRLVEG